MYTVRAPSSGTSSLLLAISALLAVLVASTPLPGAPRSIAPAPAAPIALAFTPPLGRSDGAATMEARGPDGALTFTVLGVTLALPGGDELRVEFPGSTTAAVQAGARLPGVVHSFFGSDPAGWRTNLPTYESVVYEALYPGVDLRYDGQEGALKGTYTVAPHGRPEQIHWRYPGARGLRVEPASGDLFMTTAGGRTLTERAPVAWQETAGGRVPVVAHFEVLNERLGEVGFALGAYNRTLPLVINPTLEYSSYLGGSGAETGYDIAIDSDGGVYLTGDTTSGNFPTLAPLKATGDIAAGDVFITRLNAQGQRAFSTYLGGTGSDSGLAITLDAQRNIYLTGKTGSTDFPLKDAVQPNLRGSFDAFVVKLNPAGSALLYETFFGGSGSENAPAGAAAIGVDAQGGIVIAGLTDSTDLPTASAAQGQSGGNRDAFVARLRPDGQVLTFATYLGGDLEERPRDLALDSAGAVYVTGYTTSSQFPTRNPYQAQISSKATQNAFVTKLGPDGALVYSTYLGGGATDEAFGIAVDATGSAFITGSHGFSDFPSAGAIRRIGSGGTAFLTRLAPAGDELIYSVLFGGNGGSVGSDIALDPAGSVYVAGNTTSTGFPLLNPSQATLGGGSDAFVLRIDPEGCSLIAGTLLGGREDEVNLSLAADAQGNAFIAGTTASANLPLKDAQQTTFGGSSDAFVARLQMDGTAQCAALQVFLPLIKQ